MDYECLTCGGTFTDPLPDGYRYFHACAPVWDADQKRFVERGDKRDENIRLVVDNKGQKVAQVKSEGKGRQPVEA